MTITTYFLMYFLHKLCHFDGWRNLIIFVNKLESNTLLFPYNEKSYFLTLCDFSLGRNDNYLLIFLMYLMHKLCHFDGWRNLIIFVNKLELTPYYFLIKRNLILNFMWFLLRSKWQLLTVFFIFNKIRHLVNFKFNKKRVNNFVERFLQNKSNSTFISF
jgi:hypothetical protein